MIDMSKEKIHEYLHRCYTVADGLWFMKVEEKFGFKTALDVDVEVWKVLPKIQARLLKSMSNADSNIDTFIDCLETKLTLDGFTFILERESTSSLSIVFSHCPWHNKMLSSGRESLSYEVGSRICSTEYVVFANEFFDSPSVAFEHRICNGESECVISVSW